MTKNIAIKCILWPRMRKILRLRTQIGKLTGEKEVGEKGKVKGEKGKKRQEKDEMGRKRLVLLEGKLFFGAEGKWTPPRL